MLGAPHQTEMTGSIRPATIHDIPAVAEIHKRRFEAHVLGQYSTSLIGRFYREFLFRAIFLVHEQTGQVDGFVVGAERSVCRQCKQRFMRTGLLRAAWETLWRPRALWPALRQTLRQLQLPTRESPSSAEFRLLSIAVDDRVAGTGVGTSLVAAFEKQIPQGWGVYGLSVRKDNLRAIRFYEKLGFQLEHQSDTEICFIKRLSPEARASRRPEALPRAG